MEMKILRNADEFMLLRTEWDRILRENNSENFYLSFEWFYYILHCSKNPPKNLYLIVFKKSERTAAIIPCCIVHKHLRFFDVNSFEIIGNIYSAFKGGIVLKGEENEVAEKFLAHLTETKSNDWDIIDFEYISPSDPFIAALKAAAKKRKLKNLQTDPFANLKLDLSLFSNSEEYFRSMGKNHRRNIVKRINKLNREGEFDIVCIAHNADNLSVMMEHFYAVYDESWKKKDIDPRFHARLAEHLAARGKLRLFLLCFRPDSADSRKNGNAKKFSSYQSCIQNFTGFNENFIPIAALFYVKSGDTVYALKTAYSEKYSDYSPGTVLWWFSIKYLLETDKCRRLDFQKGDEDYKFKFGGMVDETYIRYQVANPKLLYAIFEIFFECYIIPTMKRIVKSDLGDMFYRVFRK